MIASTIHWKILPCILPIILFRTFFLFAYKAKNRKRALKRIFKACHFDEWKDNWIIAWDQKKSQGVWILCKILHIPNKTWKIVQSIKVRMRPILQKSTNPISKVTPPLLGSLTLSQLSYFMLRGEKIFWLH